MRSWVWIFLPLLAGCASSSRPIPAEWLAVPHAAPARLAPGPHDSADVKIEGGKIVADGKALTPAFAAIDSFSVSLQRREVVFSAKRSDNFDIGLVSLDGGEIHWFPADPADETSIQWAPRGNKVSYVVHGKSGDSVRTVHVPTSMTLIVPFPYATVRALAWDAPAERYSVVLESPDASQRVESVKYDGTDPQSVVAPAERLDAAMEPLAGGLILRPRSLHYGERLPFVVWVADPPWVWNDALAKLFRGARLACVVVRQAPDAAFWSAVDALRWVDRGRIFVVGIPSARGTSIVPADIPGYRIAGKAVDVHRSDVESFAASWIPLQLKDRNGVR